MLYTYIRRAGWLLFCLTTVVACDRRSAPAESAGNIQWDDPAREHIARTIVQSNSKCNECIQLSLDVVLGEVDGDGYVVHSNYVVRDSVNRYWVGQYRDMIKVFDSAGRFVGRVGRQGTGPGEYSTPMPIYTDREGRIHVVDAGIPRETIVDPDFQVYTTNRLAVSPWAIVPLGDEGTYVGNLPIQSVSSLGHPLHIIRGAEIVGSFGAPQTGILDPFNLRRAITVDHSQRIYSAPLDALTIDVWDDAGRQIATFQGGPIRDGDPDDEPGILYTPSSTVSRIHIDRSEKLWILISEPRADWRDHMDIIPLPDGRKRFQPKDHDSSKIYSTRMVVLDLSTDEIVADIQREERFVAFVGDRSLVELRQLEDGTPQLAVWSIEVNLNS